MEINSHKINNINCHIVLLETKRGLKAFGDNKRWLKVLEELGVSYKVFLSPLNLLEGIIKGILWLNKLLIPKASPYSLILTHLQKPTSKSKKQKGKRKQKQRKQMTKGKGKGEASKVMRQPLSPKAYLRGKKRKD